MIRARRQLVGITRLAALSLLIGLILTPALVLAHHSFSMFDGKNQITIAGTIKEFQWTNPHVTVLVYGSPKSGGDLSLWSIELTSPGVLARLGWTRHSLKSGDRIEVLISPLRDGDHGGAFKRATLVNTGQVLLGNPNAAPDPK